MHDPSIRHLKSVDPVLASVIDRVGPCRLEQRREGTHFDALVRSIVYQQLSGKAASTILGRVHGLFGDRSPTPSELLATPDETLRTAGLSRQKLSYLKDLATKVESGVVPLAADTIDHLADDEIIDRLVQVKGIGRWTVHMFLIFRLGRPDVLPELDLGIQNAIRRAYRLRKQPGPKDVKRIGKKWTPHASIASWYLWRSLEGAAATTAKKKRPTRKRPVAKKAKPRKRTKSRKRKPSS
ncbi:MAG TPA: DNA-3-methyladenine glycosylase [Gemmatimonadaceae bacterium]|jgi:3-methyladenine DNA glycosylase/8-oxoguanine DNA glycosylase|nr:DNA-3-methyladenine glycosylase [Gemmatimonadaceae bacterium]